MEKGGEVLVILWPFLCSLQDVAQFQLYVVSLLASWMEGGAEREQ